MWDKYINVPFKPIGRDFNGSDCWGLVRLIYLNEYSIELPNFSEEYSFDDSDRIAELIAQFREGWEESKEPSIGDVILFKVLGQVQHIGVYIGNNKFIHILEGYSSVIESLDSMRWRSRISGYFKYSERASASVTAAPHPLKTESFTFPVPAGTSIEQVHKWVVSEYKVAQEIVDSVIIIRNGKIVPKSEYATTIVVDGDSLQYRALAGKGAFRMVLFIALAIAVPYLIPLLSTTALPLVAAGGALTAAGSIASIALTTLGGMLINAIAPIRPPKENADPGTATAQMLMSGSQNQANPYGSIPVVLGRVRTTGILGCQNQIDSGTDTSYLHTLLVWGFATLRVSDMRIGATSIDQYDGVRYTHVSEGYPYFPSLMLSRLLGVEASFAFDSKQQQVGVTLANNPIDGNPWTEVTILQPDTIGLSVNFHFPQGLRTLKLKGEDAGAVFPKECILEIQWRALDANSLPIGEWQDYSTMTIPGQQLPVANAMYTIKVRDWDGGYDNITYAGYRWTRLGITPSGSITTIVGAVTQSPYAEPNIAYTGTSSYNYTASVPQGVRLPAWTPDIVPLADVCVHGTSVYTVDLSVRSSAHNYIELGVTAVTSPWGDAWNGYEYYYEAPVPNISIASGTLSKLGTAVQILSLGLTQFVKRKDAFSYTQYLPVPNTGGSYQVRARRVNSDNPDPSDDYKDLHEVILQYVTAKTYKPKLLIPTNKFDVTRTALVIKADNQVNNTMEGINAFVETICPDWDGTNWIMRVTNNPASLFRLVLQHPANAYRIATTEVSSKINLVALQEWHEFCTANAFTFNNVIADQTSIMDILRDIAAAGRASPAVVDGKWTVIVDKPRTEIVQHFTNANSWDFSASKALPKMPDGLKVTYYNEDAGFQQDELIVYAPGKSAANASVFERISLPGVTDAGAVFKHARWALAQGILRPEVYTLSTDLEYLVCSRGSRVKVVNDIPMWGLGSGRIASVESATQITLTEPVPMSASGTYLIRVRSKTGSGTEYSVLPPTVDGYFTEIVLATAATEATIDVGDVFMFGSMESDFMDLIVQTVEPFGQKNAKLTLVNYAPELYTIDYLANNFTVPSFDPNITQPPALITNSIFKTPVVSAIISDETVLVRTAPGVFSPNIKISLVKDGGLPETAAYVVAYMSASSDPLEPAAVVVKAPISAGSITIPDVDEGSTYYISLRYEGSDGRLGPKSEQISHTVIGKTSPPSNVLNFTAVSVALNGSVYLSWDTIPDIDIQGYEVRAVDAGWGDSSYLYKGLSNNTTTSLGIITGSRTFYIKAVDTGGRYSLLTTPAEITVVAPSAPTGLTYSFLGVSEVDSNVTITWNHAAEGSYTVARYSVSISSGSLIKQLTTTSTEVTIPVTWTNNVTIGVIAIDVNGIASTLATSLLVKVPPSVPTIQSIAIVGTSIELVWKTPIRTSLPVSQYEVRASNSGWGDATYLWKGTATSAQFAITSLGLKTLYIKSIDSAGEYSISAASSSITVYAPPSVSSAELGLVYSDTNTSGAVATIKWVAPVVTSLPIASYAIELLKYPGSIVYTTTVSGTSLLLPVDWRTSISVSIRAIDSLGNLSAVTTKSFTKTAPSAPTSPVVYIDNSTTNMSWVAATRGDLPIDGYEIRKEPTGQGSNGFEYRGSSLSATISDLSIGSNGLYIWAFDTDGHYSSTYAYISHTVVAPSVPQSLSASFSAGITGNICTFKWVTPLTLQYPLKHYEVSFAYTTPVNTTLTNISNSTEWSIPVSWVGDGTLTVRAVDILGNSSTTQTLIVNKQAPANVGAISGIVSGEYISLSWAANTTTSLPVYTYEVRASNSGWGSGGYVHRGGTTNVDIALPKATLGTLTWYVKAIDNAGQYSDSTSAYSYTILAPSAPVTYDAEYEDTSLTAATVTLYWDQSSSAHSIKAYEISHSSNQYLEVLYSTTVTLPANWVGDRTYTIRAIDLLNNYSEYSYIVATKQLPNPVVPGSFRAQVIDNDVLLYWTLPEKTTLPISHVILRKGDTWAASEAIGNKDGTFTSISELTGGIHTYWIAVVDTDNNMSTPVSLVTTVSQPPNFVFNAEYYATKHDAPSVTKVNAFYVDSDGTLVLPANTTEDFAGHFTANGWAGPSSQISAGFPVYIQPGILSGYYEEIFDYGTTLGSSQITVILNSAAVAGAPSISVSISVSLNGIDYTNLGSVYSSFAVNFRYVKIRLTVEQVSSGDMYKVSNIIVRLDAKQKADAGTISALSTDTLGSVVNFSKPFIDVSSITITPGGTTALSAVADLKDTVLTGTYSITSNVATVSVVAHGLVTGQNVNMYISTGTGITGIYTVTSYTTDTFTVNMTAANFTGGELSTYPNSFRVYVFNSAGVRQSAPVSWSVAGY